MDKNKIFKFIDNVRGVRASLVNATAAVRDMQSIQNTYPIATMSVGRSMVAASLLASHLKNDEMVSLYFRGDGPLEMVFAEANYEGGVRGYTPKPQLNLAHRPDGSLDLTAAIGKGSLTVVRTNSHHATPYRGTVEIQTGEIGDDVAFYLQQSQQVQSVVSLGVKVNQFGQVLSAGGIIIEILPGADPSTASVIEQNVNQSSSLSELIENGGGKDEILAMYLQNFVMKEMEHPHSIAYTCRCSKERLLRSLELLPIKDLDDIISRQEEIDAKCDFCGRSYKLPWDEAKQIRDKKFRKTLN